MGRRVGLGILQPDILTSTTLLDGGLDRLLNPVPTCPLPAHMV